MQRNCDWCQRPYQAKRAASRFCGDTCRKRNLRAPRPRPAEVVEMRPVVEDHPLVVATKRELEAAGRLETPHGIVAVQLAKLMCDDTVSGTAMARVSRELSATMKLALRGTPGRPVTVGSKPIVRLVDPVDELTSRRTKRQKRGYKQAF